MARKQNEAEVTSELRIGLAMSGGIALVLYQSGVAHEILEFVKAWNPQAKSEDENEGYARAFEKVPMRPVLDILTGASAGGINCILLGSCIATGGSFAPFHDIWIDVADVSKLHYPHGTEPKSLFYTPPLVDPIVEQLHLNVKNAKGLPDGHAPDVFVRLCRTHLRGHCLTTQDALGHDIDELTKNDVVGFNTEDFLKEEQIDALTKAATATSAFPAAFPPVKSGERYYVDGGLWNNQPIDLAVRCVADKPAFLRTHRCLFFVDPDPTLRADIPDRDEQEPTFFDSLSPLPFMGVKGAIWPALQDILSHNQRRKLYDSLVGSDAASPLAKGFRQYGAEQRKDADTQLSGAAGSSETGRPGGAKGKVKSSPAPKEPNLLNQMRIHAVLFDGDPALIQRWHELLERLQNHPNDEREEESSDDSVRAGLVALRALGAAVGYALDNNTVPESGGYDLERRALRRKLDTVNNDLKLRDPELSAEDAAAHKALLYARIEDLNRYLYCDASDDTCHDPDDEFSDYLRDVRKGVSRFRQASRKMLNQCEENLPSVKTQRVHYETIHPILERWCESIEKTAAKYHPAPAAASFSEADLLPTSPHYTAIRLYHRQAEAEQNDPTPMYSTQALRKALELQPFIDEGIEALDFDVARLILSGISELSDWRQTDLIRISPNDADNLYLISSDDRHGESSASCKLAGERLGHFGGLFDKKWRRNDYIWARLDTCEILLRTLQRYGAQQGYPLDEDTYEELLQAAQTHILQQEAEAVPAEEKARMSQSSKFAGILRSEERKAQRRPKSGEADGIHEQQKINAQLIGFGGQRMGDLDTRKLRRDVDYLARAAADLILGKQVSALKRELVAELVFERVIWSHIEKDGSGRAE